MRIRSLEMGVGLFLLAGLLALLLLSLRVSGLSVGNADTYKVYAYFGQYCRSDGQIQGDHGRRDHWQGHRHRSGSR
ncbi:hypothetical protein SSTU70S_01139 [Stutzerimonas stutzeri]